MRARDIDWGASFKSMVEFFRQRSYDHNEAVIMACDITLKNYRATVAAEGKL